MSKPDIEGGTTKGMTMKSEISGKPAECAINSTNYF